MCHDKFTKRQDRACGLTYLKRSKYEQKVGYGFRGGQMAAPSPDLFLSIIKKGPFSGFTQFPGVGEIEREAHPCPQEPKDPGSDRRGGVSVLVFFSRHL